jgi:phospholipid/cholesterol/gamma-HCH transport system substrate-binding protein
VASVIAIAVVLVLILSYFLTGGGSELLQKKVGLRTFMSDSEGLTPNSPVRLNGVRVGNIVRVVVSNERDPRRVAQVEMSIHERFVAKIPNDSIAAVTADNLLGDKYIDIQAGRSTVTVSPDGEVRSLVQNQFDGSDIIVTIQALLNRVDALLTQIERGDTRLGRFFNDESFYNGVLQQLTGIQQAISSVGNAKSPAGQMFFTDRLYRALEQPILDIDKLLETMQKGVGPGGKILVDPSQYDNVVTTLRGLRKSIQDVNTGKSTLSPMLHDDALYRNAVSFVQAFGATLDDLNNGKGQLGVAFVNPQMYNSLNGTSKSLRDFTKDFRENPRKYLRIKVF